MPMIPLRAPVSLLAGALLAACASRPPPAEPPPDEEPARDAAPRLNDDQDCDPYGVRAEGAADAPLLAPSFYPGTYEFKVPGLDGATLGFGYVMCLPNHPGVLVEHLVLKPEYPGLPPKAGNRIAGTSVQVNRVTPEEVSHLDHFFGYASTALGGGQLGHYAATVAYYTVCHQGFAGHPDDTGDKSWVDELRRPGIGQPLGRIYVKEPPPQGGIRRIHQFEDPHGSYESFRIVATGEPQKRTENEYLSSAPVGAWYSRAVVELQPLNVKDPQGHPPYDQPALAHAALPGQACPP